MIEDAEIGVQDEATPTMDPLLLPQSLSLRKPSQGTEVTAS